MNNVVQEWIAKSDGDFNTAEREMAAHPANYDAVCFHCQQCIEKLLKGILIARKITPPKLHDLVELSRMLEASYTGWKWPDTDMRLLTRAAVIFRYPGEFAEAEEAQAALDVCRKARVQLLMLLRD